MPRRRLVQTGPGLLAWCRHCGEAYPTEQEVVEGVCPECLETLYEPCQNCSRHVESGSLVAFDDTGRLMCEACADASGYACASCDGVFENGVTPGHERYDGRLVCPECCETYEECSRCGRLFPEGMTLERSGEAYCFACASLMDGSEAVHTYSYKPAPIFHRAEGESEGDLMFGIELEMQEGHKDATIEAVRKLLGPEWAYFKLDGSLGRSGIEMVTHPISPTLLLSKEGKQTIAKLTAGACAAGMRSHDPGSCGLHIHICRDFFGCGRVSQTMAEYKLSRLFERFYTPLTLFARRRPRQAGEWARMPVTSKGQNWLDSARQSERTTRCTRYTAVNVTNDATIELRLYRGTLKPETLIATIQWTDGMCRWVKGCRPSEIETINWYELCDTVMAYCSSSFEELADYLVDRELYAARERKGMPKCAS